MVTGGAKMRAAALGERAAESCYLKMRFNTFGIGGPVSNANDRH